MSNPFSGCTSLSSIVVDRYNPVFDSRDNCNAIVETSRNTLVTGCKNTIIPQSITNIGWYAFSGCTGLTSITIPNSVTTIGTSAFSGCTGLTSITIPNSVTYIGGGIFTGCTGLTSINIPNSITYIHSSLFYGCTGLTTIVVDSGNPVYDSRDNCNAIINTSTNSLIYGCKNTVIPNSITSIGEDAFFYCTGLTSINIPNSVTTIGTSAFSGCTGLTSITIPNNVTNIGQYAFASCTGLTTITIPNNVTNIGQYAFASCTGLTTIAVHSGNSVYDSRDNCNAIVETSSNTLITGCKNTIIPQSITTIGRGAFSGCTGLTSINIPNSITFIGEHSFERCEGLTSVTIPNSVTHIGNDAFSRCTGLTSITLGNSLTTIDYSAFFCCKSLLNIYCYAEQIPTSDIYIFSGTPQTEATLHVPTVALDAYKTTVPWSAFGNIVALTDDDPKPTGINIVHGEGLRVNDYYDLQGRKVANPEKGIYIVNGKKMVMK